MRERSKQGKLLGPISLHMPGEGERVFLCSSCRRGRWGGVDHRDQAWNHASLTTGATGVPARPGNVRAMRFHDQPLQQVTIQDEGLRICNLTRNASQGEDVLVCLAVQIMATIAHFSKMRRR